ncbi:hypothetical protein [Rossellomorea sp. NRS-1567]|uniref:hypothetical protein n=1 Tax=Rossellomorea sp. NRS-1567 TaxID=3233901 RepID=UPI003D2B2E6B
MIKITKEELLRKTGQPPVTEAEYRAGIEGFDLDVLDVQGKPKTLFRNKAIEYCWICGK